MKKHISQEKNKLNELINKVSPCIAIGSKEAVERFKKYTEGQVKAFEIPDNNAFLCDDKIYLIPIEQSNKSIKVIIEGR